MKITIRMDDITPDMDFEKFTRFKTILDKHGIKPLIGVVPDNKDKKLQKNPPRADFLGNSFRIAAGGLDRSNAWL